MFSPEANSRARVEGGRKKMVDRRMVISKRKTFIFALVILVKYGIFAYLELLIPSTVYSLFEVEWQNIILN